MPLNNCLDCTWFYMEPSTPGYSEVTPGDDMEMGCRKCHWTLNNRRDDEASFRAKMQTATTCPDYEEVPIEEPGPEATEAGR